MSCNDCGANLVCGYDDKHNHRAQWTTEPPTEPGWYWAIRRRGGDPEMAHVDRAEPDELVVVLGHASYGLHECDYWLRIEAPEPPK